MWPESGQPSGEAIGWTPYLRQGVLSSGPVGGNVTTISRYQWGVLRLARLLALIGLMALAACATPPTDDPDALAAYEEANDPLEPMNRYFFELNYAADELLFKPFAGFYYVALPDFAQDGVRNALRNAQTPVVLANDLFQGEMERAGVTIGRFLVNSTLGVGGLFDIASRMGLEYHDEDFGQTLAVHGADEGPYLMLPLLGPSNPRDLAGRIVDTFLNPITYISVVSNVDNVGLAVGGATLLDTRARNLQTLDQVREGSLDFYATLRSLYRQSRNDEIRNGAVQTEELDVLEDETSTSNTTTPDEISFLRTEPVGSQFTIVEQP